ncbi:MAG TPA: glycerophosphodiester phosphodiesterase [Gemmatimonadaceae bacterium]|jgi:glycerophosphoryl diester phosphodiesterase|nr:glycerophosphodiester phosphodiesterase [Gemmatimonadaceae bacterium]
MAYTNERGLAPAEVIGHRGSPREFRENTLPSFQRAFHDGADGIELDVHATADRVVVVHHDPSTNARPADSGPTIRIAESTLAEVQAVPVAGERVPTLAEVLLEAPKSAMVYVEVKVTGIETEVVTAIRASDRRCAVHSFDHRVARRVAEIAPDIPTGILQTSYPVDPIRPMRDALARDLWQHWELVDEALIRLVHGDGRRVIAWTVNDARVADRLVDWGIDGICTDTPRAMRALVDARRTR